MGWIRDGPDGEKFQNQEPADKGPMQMDVGCKLKKSVLPEEKVKGVRSGREKIKMESGNGWGKPQGGTSEGGRALTRRGEPSQEGKWEKNLAWGKEKTQQKRFCDEKKQDREEDDNETKTVKGTSEVRRKKKVMGQKKKDR